MYILKCFYDIYGFLCRCRFMVIFYQIKLFGMLFNELIVFDILVDVVVDVVLMNKDYFNVLCCLVKLNISYFLYSYINLFYIVYGKYKKC